MKFGYELKSQEYTWNECFKFLSLILSRVGIFPHILFHTGS